MKCASCNNPLQKTFLDKIVGTYVKDEKGKRFAVCFECQRAFKKEELLLRIKQ
jgi:uncharacterized protein with PIN domain